jgi:hypothetical protein
MSSVNNNVQNELNIALTTGVERMAKTYGKQLVSLLASKFDFPEEEAMAYLDIVKVTKATKAKAEPKEKKTKTQKKEKPSVPLPFVGNVDEDSCKGVKLNRGLYTQCTVKPLKDGRYCKTCQKHADMNASGKPKYGDIHDRAAVGLMEYTDPNGKKPVTFGNVVNKMKLDKEVVMREAEKFGVVIPDEQWEVVEKKRGRPKSVSSETDNESETKQKRGRGRPKKVKDVESNVDDDLLSALQEAEKEEKTDKKTTKKTDKKTTKKTDKKTTKKTTKKTEEKAVEEVSSTDEEEEKPVKKTKKAVKKQVKFVEPEPQPEPEPEVEETQEEETHETDDEEEEVTEFTHDGVKYYKSQDNVLYDINTQEPVGQWNEETQEIEDINEVDSEDEVECDDE